MRWLVVAAECVWLSLVWIAIAGALVVPIEVSLPWLLALGAAGFLILARNTRADNRQS